MASAGLTEEQYKINEGVLLAIIRDYTREAGVRNLERQIEFDNKVARELSSLSLTGSQVNEIKFMLSTSDLDMESKNLINTMNPQETDGQLHQSKAVIQAGGVEQEEEEIVDRERDGESGREGRGGDPVEEEGSHQEMIIADVPVHLVFSETISPEVLEQLDRYV